MVRARISALEKFLRFFALSTLPVPEQSESPRPGIPAVRQLRPGHPAGPLDWQSRECGECCASMGKDAEVVCLRSREADRFHLADGTTEIFFDIG
jgi:hypothetical protein